MFKSLMHFFQCPLFWWRGLRGRLLESQEGEGRSRVCQRSATEGGCGREEEKAAKSLCQPDSHFIQQVANQTEEAANQQKGQCKLSNRLNVRYLISFTWRGCWCLFKTQRFFKTPLLPFQTAAVKAWETLQTSHFDDIDDVDLTFA